MGMGVSVGVSDGDSVSVGRGVDVVVDVRMEVIVSAGGMPVGASATTGEGEAGPPPLFGIHAEVASINRTKI